MKNALVLVTVVFGACTGGGGDQKIDATETIDLRAVTGEAVSPTGVTVGPDGARYVFDWGYGLYRVDSATSATLVMPIADLPTPDVAIQYPITDFAAIGQDRYVVTAIGDGYILDTAAKTLTQKFCYVPDGGGGDGGGGLAYQRTDAVAYDATTDHIFAQPATYSAIDNTVQQAELATYQGATGVAVDWKTMASTDVAQGIAVLPDGSLLLGSGSKLTRFDAASSAVVPVADLASDGVTSIQGLAYDPVRDGLIVADGYGKLVTFPMSSLAP